MPLFTPLLFVLLILGTVIAQAQGGGFSIAYQLRVGDHHHFKLTTDQHIINDRVVRIQSNLYLDVLEEDDRGNYRCRITFRSDTGRERSDTLVYRPHGDFIFSGYRLYSELGGYDAVIDALGRIIMGQSVAPKEYDQGTMTAFTGTTDIEATERVNVPYSVTFSIPRSPEPVPINIGSQLNDTILVTSSIQPITVSTGPSHQRPIKRTTNVDTIVRTTTLDSVTVIEGRPSGHFTTMSHKHTIRRERYTIVTATVRDMETGLVRSILERCYFESPKGQRLEYVTTCVRVSPDPFDPLFPQRQGVDGP